MKFDWHLGSSAAAVGGRVGRGRVGDYRNIFQIIVVFIFQIRQIYYKYETIFVLNILYILSPPIQYWNKNRIWNNFRVRGVGGGGGVGVWWWWWLVVVVVVVGAPLNGGGGWGVGVGGGGGGWGGGGGGGRGLL